MHNFISAKPRSPNFNLLFLLIFNFPKSNVGGWTGRYKPSNYVSVSII